MVTAEMYKNYLSSYGSNLAQVKKNQSDAIMNNSFTADAQYKRVYILTKDGWKWEDAKYQRHAKLSILKDPMLNKDNLINVLGVTKDTKGDRWYKVSITKKEYVGYVSAKYIIKA